MEKSTTRAFVLLILAVVTSQQITDISQVPAITALPCISVEVKHIITYLRYTNCPQTQPGAFADCVCDSSTNSASFYTSLSTFASFNCGGRASEDVLSGMQVYSTYCALVAHIAMTGDAKTSSTGTTSTKLASSAQTGSSQIRGAATSETQDLSKTSITMKTTASTNSGSASTSTTPVSASTAPVSSIKTSSSLGTGEIVGIVCGIVSALAAIIGVWFAWRRKKAQEAAVVVHHHYGETTKEDKPI